MQNYVYVVYCVAYAGGSEHDSDEGVEDNSVNTSGVAFDLSTASTDTGRDKLQHRSGPADRTGDMTVVCPSGEALDAVVTKSASSDNSHKCSSMFKSCSMPQICCQPLPVTQVDVTSLDSELRYLSTYAKLQQYSSSPLENSKTGRIARSPYMSPLLASDEMLQHMCPVHLIVRVAWFCFWSTF